MRLERWERRQRETWVEGGFGVWFGFKWEDCSHDIGKVHAERRESSRSKALMREPEGARDAG